MYSDMSMRIRCSSESNRNVASALHSSVLPTPVGPRNRNDPYGRFGIRQPRARAADRVRDEAHRLVLADHALVQPLFHLDQLLALALHHLRHRDAGGARHHLGDFLGADLRAQQPRLSHSASPRTPPSSAAPRAAAACRTAAPRACRTGPCAAARPSARRSFSISSLMCWLPCTCAFSAFHSSSRSEYSFSSFLISSSIRANRLLRGLVLLLPARPRARCAAGSGGARGGPSTRAWSRSPS